ncbi:MAG: hypothetical protein FWG72_06620 [Oscillospiraceae bacterium]|nr:hypothetical protein [Oscillospiraceae bacterium]
MKRNLCLLLALLMLFAFAAACASPSDEDPTPGGAPPTPSQAGSEDPPPPPTDNVPDTFLWDDFDLDPQSPAELSANGVNRWWWNDGNTRQAVEDGVLQIQYRPRAFDPEDFDDMDDYYARAADWMGNWGEAINMWDLEGISWCQYLTIRMRGAAGGEESGLILHFQPNDGPVFAKRFSDLVTADGGSPQITTDMQDIVIDLAASGFPGMTNRMHIRSFAAYTIFLDEISFSGPVSPINTDDPNSEITLPEIPLSDLPVRSYTNFLWENFTDRDPLNKPDLAVAGVPMWWDNWANLRASVEDGVAQIEFRPGAFDPEDYDDLDEYYARAMDWMGNWGQAVDVWAIDGIAYARYLTIRVSGAEGGEENKLLLHFQPEDGPVFIKRFSELVTADGGNVQITTDMQDVVIDLEASGFPGMTNRMHIRAFAGCTIFLDEMFFSNPVKPISGDVLAGITVPDIPLGDVAGYVAELD